MFPDYILSGKGNVPEYRQRANSVPDKKYEVAGPDFDTNHVNPPGFTANLNSM